MRRLLVLLLFVLFSLSSGAQELGYRMGLGFGIDMGLRADRGLPDGYIMQYQNVATPTIDICMKISVANFNFVPDFKISYATFGKGKRKAINTAGTSMPEGDYVTITHAGSFLEQIERPSYLLNRSDLTMSTLSAGTFVTYSLFRSRVGYLEAGTGAFYLKKQRTLKDFMAYDVYDYYGSAGSHETPLQTDEYIFTETVRADDPTRTERITEHLIAIPVTVQYNFRVGLIMELSPSFTAWIGKDPYYNLNFSVSFGGKKQY